MRNDIVAKTETHSNFTSDAIARAVAEISRETGFVSADREVQRRFIYTPDKTWRVRIAGTFNGRPALLRIENLKLEIDEEVIRAKFREQAEGSRVRPPRTYASAPFDETKGYAYSLDEQVVGQPLFEPTDDPAAAAAAFAAFYRELRAAVTKPFWPVPTHTFRTSTTPIETRCTLFTQQQLDTWLKLATHENPEAVARHAMLLDRMRSAMLRGVAHHSLRFMHPHLAGTDVRVTPSGEGEYVVFANHFWSWRQPGYDLAFPIWGQWLALPKDRRTVEVVTAIGNAWIGSIVGELSDLVDVWHVRTMLLNRIYGSLILDVPAIARREGESAQTVAPLELALVAEAEKLLGNG